MSDTKQYKSKLEVTQVYDIKPVGDKGAELLKFKAKNGDGKEILYETFSKRLFPYIEVGKTFEADIEQSPKEYQGETFLEHRVKQIYIDGKPVSGQQKKGWSGWSPDNRLSIESQVAAKLITEREIAGLPMAKDLKKLRDDWLRKTLNAALQGISYGDVPEEPQKQFDPETETWVKSYQASPDKRETASKENGKGILPESIKTLGNLFNACFAEFKMGPAEVVKQLGYSDKKEIPQPYSEAWLQIKNLKEGQ